MNEARINQMLRCLERIAYALEGLNNKAAEAHEEMMKGEDD